MTHAAVLGSKKKGIVFVISAPAGTGKTTLAEMLVQEFSSVVESVSFTTRNPRPGEIEGRHYHFVSVEEFKRLAESGEFIEHVRLYNDYYGTSKSWIESRQKDGKHVLLVIDTQGALALQKAAFKAVYVFVLPPSLEVLKERLILRGTEASEKIQERLSIASKEIALAKFYDYCIVNDNLHVTYQVIRSIVIAEGHRVEKDKSYIEEHL